MRVVVLTDTFLKEVEKRALEFERYMDTALPQMTEMDDIIRTVWGADQWKSRAQSVSASEPLPCVSASEPLPCVGTAPLHRVHLSMCFFGACVSVCVWCEH